MRVQQVYFMHVLSFISIMQWNGQRFKFQPLKMVKHTQTIVGLAGLTGIKIVHMGYLVINYVKYTRLIFQSFKEFTY